jgi:uncharacterized integral membrane protein
VSSEGSDFEGLTRAPGSTAADAGSRRTAAARRERVRLISGAILGAVVTAFALLNLDEVKVNWLFASGRTPLIVVIGFAFVLGMLVDRLVARARRKRRREAIRAPRRSEP